MQCPTDQTTLVMSERAGLIGLTLEGYMLGGAFFAVLGSFAGALRPRSDHRW